MEHANDSNSGESGPPWPSFSLEHLGAALAAASQIVAALATWPKGYREAGFFIVLLAGFAVVIWATSRRPGRASALFLGASFVAVILFVAPSLPKPLSQTFAATPSPKAYYMNVLVYDDRNDDGRMDGSEQPQADVQLSVRDQFGYTMPYVTTTSGQALVTLRNYGDIYIGACHIFESHTIPSEAADPNHPYGVEIGINLSKVGSC